MPHWNNPFPVKDRIGGLTQGRRHVLHLFASAQRIECMRFRNNQVVPFDIMQRMHRPTSAPIKSGSGLNRRPRQNLIVREPGRYAKRTI
jgi:hypothetical protein